MLLLVGSLPARSPELDDVPAGCYMCCCAACFICCIEFARNSCQNNCWNNCLVAAVTLRQCVQLSLAATLLDRL
jgi:hypothetical protein